MVESIGPYRVVERLGVGGMGEVYKAYDDRLDRWVAIKRIRPDKEHADDNRERFQREARATAKLNHSSIVHVYDIFLDGDSECIVMEYVEGRTLDTMILEGPLDPTFAARLGYEISSGLAEAHAKGIIHRDLKVENIIITPTGHAKILDFGLAKPIISNELDTSLTGKGQLVGTSRAMSPEYVSGEEIDHRSDLFSFGVLLYEAATGHSPFKAHNTLATLKQVMLHVQTPAFQVVPDIPEDFSNLIDRLLEKDPSDRPQSSDEVALEFENILGGLSSEAIPRPRIGGSSTFRRSSSAFSATATAIESISQRPWAKLLAAFLVIAIAGIGWMVVRSFEDPPEEAPPIAVTGPSLEKKERILVGAFDNRTGEAELSDAASYAFRTSLEQASNLQVLSKAQIRDALKRMEKPPDTAITLDLGIELCKREGVKAMVFGSIVKIGNAYQVTGTVIDPRTETSTLTENSEASNQDGIISALSLISQKIRVNLGESLELIEEKAPLQKVTTSNFEALQAYHLAIRQLSEDNSDNAIELLQAAIDIDPDFAMAHAKLATVYIDSKGDYTQALEHIDEALAVSERLTSVEKFYVEGWSARLRGTAADVIQVWTLMSQLYPERHDAHYNKAIALWQYRYALDKATKELETALESATDEDRPRVAFRLGVLQMAAGNFEAAREQFELVPQPNRAGAMAQLALANQEIDVARSHIEEIRAFDPERTSDVADDLLLPLLLFQGELQAALDQVGNAFSNTGPMDTTMRLTNAGVAELLENVDQDRLRRATSINPKLFEDFLVSGQPLDRAPVIALCLLGKIAARNQMPDSALAIHAVVTMLAAEKQIPLWDSHLRMLEGEMVLAKGDEEQALKKFLEALALADHLQIHESLGRVYTEISDTASAIREYRWIEDHRGRALAECQSGCFPLNVLDWSLASYRLGHLYDRADEPDRAKASYSRFVDHWANADTTIPYLEDARARLEALP